jgi:hypothetical protein
MARQIRIPDKIRTACRELFRSIAQQNVDARSRRNSLGSDRGGDHGTLVAKRFENFDPRTAARAHRNDRRVPYKGRTSGTAPH